MNIDLHLHTSASDGQDSPADVLQRCADKNITLCSVTDHDTILGQAEAAQAAQHHQIEYISGVELSVSYSGGELHLLGYGIDYQHNRPLIEALSTLRQSRIHRAHAILKKLNAHAMPLRFADVERCAGGESIGRPHIAQAMINKGYVSSVNEAFDRYLSDRGSCYVGREKLPLGRALGLIHAAGGTSVLAHPKYIKTTDFSAFMRRMKKKGLMGIEAYYPSHSPAEVERFLQSADALDLLVTSGSDYHGSLRPHADIGCEQRSGPRLVKSIEQLRKRYL